ncbi:MAG TPA: hypothetical protein VL048_14920 [Xanthobacteraceae bacterium]|nr:hypothetical protein [Xanthobacteraceae bacterium]
MALSLIAYFCTMMSALAVFVALLSSVLPPRRFPEPHPIVVAEQATISVNTAVPKITTRAQTVVDAMASNKQAVVASQRPSSGEGPRHLMRHRLWLPHQRPSGNSTALVLHNEYLEATDNHKKTQPSNSPAVFGQPLGYKMSRRISISSVIQ